MIMAGPRPPKPHKGLRISRHMEKYLPRLPIRQTPHVHLSHRPHGFPLTCLGMHCSGTALRG